LLARLTAVALALTGVAHLVVPDLLLRTARWGYDRVLAVDFEPRENAIRRVRTLGLVFLSLAAVCWRAGRD